MTRRSFFTRWANAQLKYQVATGSLISDPDTGNVSEELTPTSASALLEVDMEATRRNPGLDAAEIAVKGYMVKPMLLPITLPATIDCTLDHRRGRLDLDATIPSPWGKDKFLGQRLRGIFRLLGREYED